MDPELAFDLVQLDKTLREENLSVRSRLMSVHRDAKFVQRLGRCLGLPLVPNERCGSWYVEKGRGSVYFKSTDGHTNNWGFSTRRLNLQVLGGECIVVDSTRRGKVAPDALSKTIPIWCAVMNKIMDPTTSYDEELVVDPVCVSDLERSMILEALEGPIEETIKPYRGGVLSLASLKDAGLQQKLWPVLVTPRSDIDVVGDALEKIRNQGYAPIVLATASEMASDGQDKSQGWAYVQGAGDDHELWSQGLTPELFWQKQDLLNEEALLNKTNADAMAAIQRAISATPSGEDTHTWDITPMLSFGKIQKGATLASPEPYDRMLVMDPSIKSQHPNVHVFNLESNSKKSSKLLRKQLPAIVACASPNERTLVACGSGTDLGPCVAICVLLNNTSPNKIGVRTALQKLTELHAQVQPQRATLTAINDYLIK